MASKEHIISFLLNIPPDKLSAYCSTNERIAEICASDDFIKAYSKKHAVVIKKRKALKKSATKFLPRFPVLPKEKAPDGYRVSRKWHWQYEVWAPNAHYKDHNQGEIPHFDISPDGRTDFFHVYLDAQFNNFLVIDEKGLIIFVYAIGDT